MRRVEGTTTLFGEKTIVHFWGVDHERESTNWNFDRKNPESLKKIIWELPERVNKLFLPCPTKSNAEIVGIKTFRPFFDIYGVKVYGGVDADGCVFEKVKSSRTAFAIAPADCATIVARSNDEKVVIAAHGGRDSTLDRGVIEFGQPTRKNFGVVDAILIKMHSLGYQPEEVFFGIFGGIRSNFEHHPENAKYGRYNRGLIEFCRSIEGALLNEETGEVDMYCIIRGAATRLGVPLKNISFDSVDTGSDKFQDETPMWASHRNGMSDWRNLIVVHPYWD